MLFNNTGQDPSKYIHPSLNVSLSEVDKNQKVKVKGISFKPQIPDNPLKIEDYRINTEIQGEIPISGALTGKFKISNDEIRLGAGGSLGKVGYAGGFVNYDFKSGQVGVGAEAEVLGGIVQGEALAGYNFQEDKLDLKLSASLFDNQFDIVHIEVKDIAQNMIGKPLDAIGNAAESFYNHVSPQARASAAFVNDLRDRAGNVKDISGLGDIIRFAGENEDKMKGSLASFQLHKATFNYLEQLDDRVSTNTRNIEINSQRIDFQHEWLKQHDIELKKQAKQIAIHDMRLDMHDKILAVHTKILNCHEKRLNYHEHLLNVHSKMLAAHENRLNRHEAILNTHEKRLNQHENILNFHGTILREHEARLNQHAVAINNLFSIAKDFNQILNVHGQKINELDERMFYAEKNIVELNKQVNIHSEILSQHGEILQTQGQCIKELYDVANDQQIQLNQHQQLINVHQTAIVELCYDFHGLKDRVNKDEKVINQIGEELSKVINYSIDTRNVVEGLSQQTQIHRDLIVQNYESIKEVKEELSNQAKFILYQQEFMKDIAKQVDMQWIIIEQHDKEIKELTEFVNVLSKEIENIYNEIDDLKNKINNIEKKLTVEIEKQMKIKQEKKEIEERVNKLIEIVDDFDENKKWDFIKCMYMAINLGVYNLQQMEIVVKNILKIEQ